MAEIDKKIILHYFDYKEKRNVKGLEEYCIEIHSYKRKSFALSSLLSAPYIVQSRVNKELINRLNQDSYSIILEGVHCAGILPSLKNRNRVIVRMLNEEAEYYKKLAESESKSLKRKYYARESKLLEQYQKKLDKNLLLACLSEMDIELFKKKYGFANLHFIPCFIAWQDVTVKEGKGDYCLYQGNMGVVENEEAVLWLIRHVFSKTGIPFTVAGKNISNQLLSQINLHKNISAVESPNEEQMTELIQNAHINVLPSMNSTGVKLKVLHAALKGRFCITNSAAIEGTNVTGVTITDNEKQFLELVQQLMKKNFTKEDITERQKILDIYNNKKNAEKLSALL